MAFPGGRAKSRFRMMAQMHIFASRRKRALPQVGAKRRFRLLGENAVSARRVKSGFRAPGQKLFPDGGGKGPKQAGNAEFHIYYYDFGHAAETARGLEKKLWVAGVKCR
jgi:hypothetical protein